ncbi:hypothetical protein HHI36_017142 [Cryptolaemus montrouzieri]|uniref:Uncharacterized protein n=1 Tax=Cryptolaemus montrouzieri TaxID=559131 RepID=A0ABD2NLP0_9CUCU
MLVTDSSYSYKADRLIKDFQGKYLNIEIDTTFCQISNISRDISNAKQHAISLMPAIVVQNFSNYPDQYFESLERKISEIHERKLQFLIESQSNYRVEVDREWVFNGTDVALPSQVRDTLALGLKFSIPLKGRKVPRIDIITEVENIILSREEYDGKTEKRAICTNIITNSVNAFPSGSKNFKI